MPYKEVKLFWRVWVNRGLKPRLDKYLKNVNKIQNKTQLEAVSEAVDTFLTKNGYPAKTQ